jgi:hypothetical protein
MRTTSDAVMDIIETTLESYVVERYINSASVMIDSNLTNKGLSDALLVEIEMWLSAHLIAATRERMAKDEGAGGAYIKYAGAWGEGLTSTPYGQPAMSLDSSGTLSSLSKGRNQASTRAIPQFE